MMNRTKPTAPTYSEQLSAILDECRKNVEDAAREYENEIRSLFRELREKSEIGSETLH